MDQVSQNSAHFGAFDDPAAQRDGSRDSLLLSAQLRHPVGATPIAVRVRNLSPGGLMAEYGGRAAIGDAVAIDVRGVGWVDGQVAWVAEGRMGIAFDAPIDPLRARKPVAVSAKAPPAVKRGRAVL